LRSKRTRFVTQQRNRARSAQPPSDISLGLGQLAPRDERPLGSSH
jgi:hypothetical protein